MKEEPTQIEDPNDEGWIQEAQKFVDEKYNNNPKSRIKVNVLNREQALEKYGGGYVFLKPKPKKPKDTKA